MNIITIFMYITLLGLFTELTYANNMVRSGERTSILLQSQRQAYNVLPQPEKIGNRFGGFSRSAAVTQCARKGLRLPTIRELATWGQQYGGRIRESSNKGRAYSLEIDLMQRDGFKAVYLHRTHMQKIVDFYYNSKQFQIPVGTGLARFAIWTSDIRHVDGVDGYVFFAGSGMFIPSNNMREHAVSCVVHNFMQ